MTAETIDEIVITEPGVYEMPDDMYHRDPVPGGSLSSSGAKKLLPPYCPAIFDHERKHGRPDTRAFDLGHAAHKLVLGSGPKIVKVDADSWRTNAAKDAASEIRAAGGVPLLPDDYALVHAMADALRQHPVASALFDPEHGQPEQSLFWRDEPTGVNRRARLDWLPNASSGRMIIPDYKTSVSANPAEFEKSVANYGYHQQAAWYIDAAIELGLAEVAEFVFVIQQKTAPFLVTVVQLDLTAMDIGRALNRRALDIYAHCTATGRWPGYSDDVALVSVPAWYARNYEENL